MNQGFTYIWTLKYPIKKNSHKRPINDPHKVYIFKRRANGNIKVYNPNRILVNNHQTALNKLKNNTFTPANYNRIKESVQRKNVHPLHMYIMVKNIIRARNVAQNRVRCNYEKISNPTNKQTASYKKSTANHNKRLKEWKVFMNVAKNLILPYNSANNLVQRYIRNLAPTNFPNNANRRRLIKDAKNGIISYHIRANQGPRFGPGVGFEYYNRHGRVYNNK